MSGQAESGIIEGGAEVSVDMSAQVAGLRARLVQAELRTEAVRAGMVDLDGVRLIEPSSLTLNDSGELTDPAGVMAKLKADKPWLFTAAGSRSSSSGAMPPRATVPVPKTAMQMTVEEWRLARAELLRRV